MCAKGHGFTFIVKKRNTAQSSRFAYTDFSFSCCVPKQSWPHTQILHTESCNYFRNCHNNGLAFAFDRMFVQYAKYKLNVSSSGQPRV